MERIVQLVGGILLLSFITGCATGYTPKLQPDQRDNISSFHVIVMTPQEEINGQFIPSNSAAAAGINGGFIGALIGSGIDAAVNTSRAKEAETAVAPLRNMLLEFDFHAESSAAYFNALSDVRWMTLASTDSNHVVEDFELEEYLPEIGADALLVLSPEYSLSPELDAVHVGMSAELFEKHTPSNKASNNRKKISPISKVYVQYQSPSLNPGWVTRDPDEIEREIAQLTTDYEHDHANGNRPERVRLKLTYDKNMKKLKQATIKVEDRVELMDAWEKQALLVALREGIEQTAALAVLHLNDNLEKADYKEKEISISMVNAMGVLSRSVTAYELQGFPERKVYRLANGFIYSVPDGEPLRAPAMIR